jgi:choline-glycine betaine transporter
MGFDLGEKRSPFEILMTPGPIITMIGLVILGVSVFFFSSAAPSGSDVDAILAAQGNHGQKIKSMVGMVGGTLVSIAGVLLSLMKFSRS